MTTTSSEKSGTDEGTHRFPRAASGSRGYDRVAVDTFLARARRAFEAPLSPSDTLTAQDVRQVAFPLVKKGYDAATVDAALARVEDAFAAREREDAVSASGTGAWIGKARADAQEILDRITREPRRRFDRVGPLRFGYRIAEVDVVTDKIAAFLAQGKPVTVEQVRQVAFRMQRGGYRETQVDAVLDAVVAVMLAVA